MIRIVTAVTVGSYDVRQLSINDHNQTEIYHASVKHESTGNSLCECGCCQVISNGDKYKRATAFDRADPSRSANL